MRRTENAMSERDEEFGAFIRSCAPPLGQLDPASPVRVPRLPVFALTGPVTPVPSF